MPSLLALVIDISATSDLPCRQRLDPSFLPFLFPRRPPDYSSRRQRRSARRLPVWPFPFLPSVARGAKIDPASGQTARSSSSSRHHRPRAPPREATAARAAIRRQVSQSSCPRDGHSVARAYRLASRSVRPFFLRSTHQLPAPVVVDPMQQPRRRMDEADREGEEDLSLARSLPLSPIVNPGQGGSRELERERASAQQLLAFSRKSSDEKNIRASAASSRTLHPDGPELSFDCNR